MSDNEKAKNPYSLGRLFLYYTNNLVFVAKMSLVERNMLGLMYWHHKQKKWDSICGASAIPLTESLEDELEDLELASNPDFIKAMRGVDVERCEQGTSTTGDSSPDGFELTLGTIIGDRIVTHKISETEAYCRPLSFQERCILSDSDWRAWLKKPDKTDHFESEILHDCNGDFVVIPPHTKADKWMSGTPVKVTLELVED